jgi:uncharacterized protein (DUF111 family)
MKTIYFNCENGVSGDMVNMALKQLLGESEENAMEEVEKFKVNLHDFSHLHDHDHNHGHDHDNHGHDHDHHGEHTHDHDHHNSNKSYSDIKKIISSSEVSENAKAKALAIYAVIAKAEASAHSTTIEDVHFHEVGRDEAITNIVGTAIFIDAMGIEQVYCSEICDGTGFIECSHGIIPVPVPAVMAMRKESDLVFVSDESVKTEMVTPSGLAMIMGLGAKYCREIPQDENLKKATVFGKRKTGRAGGFSAYLFG